MPATDVVRHNLTVSELMSRCREDEIEPMPLPVIKRVKEAPIAANAPTTTMITPPAIDTGVYSSVGKVRVKFESSNIKGASGWVVATRAIITAGHCVYNKKFGGWISQAGFCPRFNVQCPGKSYKVEAVFTLQGWIDSSDSGDEDRQYDMAACLVTENFTIADLPLLFEVDALPALQYAAVGYPITPIPEYEFNGKRMWQALGDSIKCESSVLWAENNLTNGASGGPWFAPADHWYVNGLTSARLDDDQNVAVSPYFGQGFSNLYDAVKNL